MHLVAVFTAYFVQVNASPGDYRWLCDAGDQAHGTPEPQFLKREHSNVPIQQQVHAGGLVRFGDGQGFNQADGIDRGNDLLEFPGERKTFWRFA